MVDVLVTEPEYRKAADIFSAAGSKGVKCTPAPPDEAGLVEMIGRTGAKHVIVGVERYSDALYQALKRGAVLARFGVGHDGVDKPRATASGILVTNTPGALDDSVAELTIGLIIAAARHLPTVCASTRGGEWKPIVGAEVRGRRVALIGVGSIGQRVARAASLGLGMKVIGCGRRPADITVLRERCGIEHFTTDWAEAVEGADFVSLHIPAIPDTRHFLNADRLAKMPAQSWLINTARGMIVDETALYDHLAAGKLGGAALDVFEKEPYVPAHPQRDLRTLPNVIMTPHIGSSTREACVRMAESAIANILAAERGDHASMNIVNTDVLAGFTKGKP